MPFTGSYITSIDHTGISLIVLDKELRQKIKALGGKGSFFLYFLFKENRDIYPESKKEEYRILQALMDMDDVYFMHGGPGWHPASVVNQLRDEGILHGKIRHVVNPGFDKFKTYVK